MGKLGAQQAFLMRKLKITGSMGLVRVVPASMHARAAAGACGVPLLTHACPPAGSLHPFLQVS